MVRRISCAFEKKRAMNLTRVVQGTRHPLPSSRTATRGVGTSSSSGGTTTGGGGYGTSSSNGTVTGGLGPPLPLVGPRQQGPVGLGLPLPPAGPQQF
jgi:hypothetical protein